MREKLEGISIISFIIHGTVSVRLLNLPRHIVEQAEHNGWLSVILMGLYTFFVGYAFYWIGQKYKGLNYSEICKKVFGKFIGSMIVVGIGVYTINSVGLGARMFADGLKIYLLDNTPLTLVIVIMILTCLYCLLNGVRTISIVLDILLPFVLFFVAILIVFSFTNINFAQLKPYFYGGIKPITLGAIEAADPFLTVGIIGYILPYLKEDKKMKRWIFIGIGVSTVIYLLVVLMCIMTFGSEEIKYLLFPTITLSKSIRFENNILERAESLFMAAWIPISFTTILLFYFASTLNLKALVNSKKDRLIIFIQIPIFLFIALYPDNIAQVFRFIKWNSNLGKVLMFVVVPLSIIIQILKNRRRKSYSE